MDNKPIKQFYGVSVDYEWKRLTKDTFHRLEFETTLYFLKKYLPKNGLVLDAGGGPGRYTIELAKMGHRVDLLDYTPELLEKAKKTIARAGVKSKVNSVAEGSITDLSRFGDNHFEAVVCLGGPLSHVKGETERQKAVAELVRVTKKGGHIFIAVMGRFGVMNKILRNWPDEVENTKHFREMWQEGEDDKWHKDYYCHFFLPEELERLVETQATIVERVGLEGLVHFREDAQKVSKKMPEAWKNWMESHYQLCTHPAVFANSDHMMVVCRKG